jgi:hypothetical protein
MRKIIFFGFLFFLFFASAANAAEAADTDGDGVNDYDEINIYHTDPAKADTDGDGYGDKEELVGGYSPFAAGKIKLELSDFDQDGLSDRMEYNFHVDPTNPDTDGDGHQDGAEVKAGYDPASSTPVKLKKRVEINLAKQELSYFLGNVRLGKFLASSGTKANPTPKGVFTIGNKNPKAWSSYGLWMPYWLGIKGRKFGIHELPYWPSGKREGESSLGRPASHGCIRVGRNGEAKTLYDRAEIGTPVIIN